nr:MAG TPA_asm: hypothetical protein [Caudoviricetes sp.]
MGLTSLWRVGRSAGQRPISGLTLSSAFEVRHGL